MTQGELEQISQPFVTLMTELERRIMEDIVRLIEKNGFSPASADWKISRLQQLGESEEEIKRAVQDALGASETELDEIFSDTVYKEYYGHGRAYKLSGMQQILFRENKQLQSLIEATRQQTNSTFKNLTASMGFAERTPTGVLKYKELRDFYVSTLDSAMMDIHSGAFDYNTVLKRVVDTMTTSGLRWIDYESGHHDRVDVAARRAVMTGFRQIQGKINEQVARDLRTDSYEVTYHVGARPTHQPWQGRIWTYQELQDVCGLGTVTGLHGANCYHDYHAFIPGVSVRTYTDEQLEKMIEEENTPKEYNGKSYTTYEALQAQRRMERNMRKTRQDINLLKQGQADPTDITLKQAKYQGQMQTYRDFSKKMGLPQQMDRVYQDGLKGSFSNKAAYRKIQAEKLKKDMQKQMKELLKQRESRFADHFETYNNGQKDIITTRRLMNNLNKTETGKETIEYIMNHPELDIKMCYNIDHDPGIRGMQINNEIWIHASDTKTVQNTAETLIHEITHHKYDIGGTQWAECVCFAQELKHKTGKTKLTGTELKNIIKTVAELYPDYPWRK